MYKLWFFNTISYFQYKLEYLLALSSLYPIQNLRKEICIK